MWQLAGILALGVAFLGFALPLLPGVPFLVLAAYCFSRGSRRLHDWLVNHPQLGSLIRQWRENRGIPRRVKLPILLVLASSLVAPVAFEVPIWALALHAAVIVGVGIYIATRPSPP